MRDRVKGRVRGDVYSLAVFVNSVALQEPTYQILTPNYAYNLSKRLRLVVDNTINTDIHLYAQCKDKAETKTLILRALHFCFFHFVRNSKVPLYVIFSESLVKDRKIQPEAELGQTQLILGISFTSINMYYITRLIGQ